MQYLHPRRVLYAGRPCQSIAEALLLLKSASKRWPIRLDSQITRGVLWTYTQNQKMKTNPVQPSE